MPALRALAVVLVLVLASCTEATEVPRSDAAATCPPIRCEPVCEHGLARDADGCETCTCAPPPDDSCRFDEDCALGVDVSGCCGCETGVSAARLAAEPCLIGRGESPPAGCLPDPNRCASVRCAGCEAVVRAICLDGMCAASGECAEGQVPFERGCVAACGSHDDCTLAADYESCCGSCSAVPVSFVEADPCWAESQAASECAPSAGACDGLGCPSPPTDCSAFGGAAFCMADGSCRQTDGECPAGTSDRDGVCVSD